jgi:hypothetical protein
MPETDNHITLLIACALRKAKAENFADALDFLQKATDQITQLTARRQQARMVGGGRPYRQGGQEA